MKKIGLFIMVAVFSFKVSAQTAPADTLKFAADKKEISTFMNLMHIAGLDTIYNGRPVTIFAPDNGAFEKMPSGMPDSLSKPANLQKLVALLDAHIVSNKMTAKELGKLIRANNGQTTITTLSGSKLTAKINANRNIFLTNDSGDESIVSKFDIQHFNATFFIIKSVLLHY